MYTFDSRVRYSETAEDGRISLNAIIDYMQDCTNFQSEDLGVGLEFHAKHGLMWVLNSWQIIVEQYPKMGEMITVGTQSTGYEKMFGYRNFLITDAQGACVAKANSNWVLMDLKKGRPMIVTPEIGDVYGKAEPLEMEYAPRKIKLPEGGTAQEEIVVHEYHLDTNHHVNNRQYVQMAMTYLRLDSDETDYAFRTQPLDPIIRQAVRRFSGEFILRKLRLDYEPVDRTVVTDEKWLTFVLEQLLSNALKYTRTGSIRIFLRDERTLCVADTGIGIAKDDLPRIFEKGFTGATGRAEQSASGLGLYLCRRVCKALNIAIRAESTLGAGTTVFLTLPDAPGRTE